MQTKLEEFGKHESEDGGFFGGNTWRRWEHSIMLEMKLEDFDKHESGGVLGKPGEVRMKLEDFGKHESAHREFLGGNTWKRWVHQTMVETKLEDFDKHESERCFGGVGLTGCSADKTEGANMSLEMEGFLEDILGEGGNTRPCWRRSWRILTNMSLEVFQRSSGAV